MPQICPYRMTARYQRRMAGRFEREHEIVMQKSRSFHAFLKTKKHDEELFQTLGRKLIK